MTRPPRGRDLLPGSPTASRLGLALALAGILLAALPSPAAATQAADPPGGDAETGLSDAANAHQLDPQVITRRVSALLEETGVETRPPEAGLRDWIAAMASRVNQWLANRELLSDSALGWIGTLGGWIGVALIVCGIIAIVIVLVRTLRPGRAGSRSRARLPDHANDELPESPGAAYWLDRFEEELAANRLREALQAIWSWLVASTTGPEIDASWTTGDLLRASQIRSLRAPLRQLDAMVYGAVAADVVTVRGLAESLQRIVARENEP